MVEETQGEAPEYTEEDVSLAFGDLIFH